MITSRSVFGLLWSFSLPWGLWAQLQVVTLLGALASRYLPPEQVWGMLQGLPCRGRSRTDSLPWVTQLKVGQRLLFPVQCRGVGKLPLEGTPGACAQRPFPSRSWSLLASKSMLHLASASHLCSLICQCCSGRKENDLGGAPSRSSLCFPLTWALCEISLWPPVKWSQPLLDNVRTCLDLTTEHKSENYPKRNFKFENFEELDFCNCPWVLYISTVAPWALSFRISEMKKKNE